MSWTWVVAFLVIILIGYGAYRYNEQRKVKKSKD